MGTYVTAQLGFRSRTILITLLHNLIHTENEKTVLHLSNAFKEETCLKMHAHCHVIRSN